MTIASSDNYLPWAAPVYYIYKQAEFYFFSKASSRHIKNTAKSNKAAASIHFNSYGWKDIKGLQMEGTIQAAGINPKSASALNSYIKKFNFTDEIKKSSTPLKDLVSFESAFKVNFYKFIPATVYYLDNSIRFGLREIVVLH